MFRTAGFVVAAVLVVTSCGAGSPDAPVAVESAITIVDADTEPSGTEVDDADVDDGVEAADEPAVEPATTVSITTVSITTVPTTIVSAEAGAESLGDPYVGDFGNGGYDVLDYDLALDWDPDAEHLDGIATISAAATQSLAAFNLELTGFDITRIEVDGASAAFERSGDEVTIVPAASIVDGEEFTTVVEYSGTPMDHEFVAGDVGRPSGWHTRDGFAYVAGEPLGASTFHPANDHPSDKASFTYRITAPSELTVAASGTLQEKVADGDWTTWTFHQPDPQATYLTTLAIGDFTVIDGGTSASGVPIRNVIDSELVDRIGPVFDAQPEMIDAFEELFGPYPFEVYGALVVNDSFGGALETQTLSIFGADVVVFGDAQYIVAHELAHQWFGNDVSLQRWEDIWLNEGFASYGEALWEEASDVDFSFQDWIRGHLQFGPGLERHVVDPGPSQLFGQQVYLRGAFTIHALRLRVGDDVFFDILRTWNERFGGGNVTTGDFEDLSEELSGDDLDQFFDDWLRSDELPPELDGVALGG